MGTGVVLVNEELIDFPSVITDVEFQIKGTNNLTIIHQLEFQQ